MFMQEELIITFEKAIDQEALTSLPAVINFYYQNDSFSFSKKVEDSLPSHFKSFWCEIEWRIVRYICLQDQGVNLYQFKEDYQSEKEYLYQYYQSCQDNPSPTLDHKKIARKLAKTIVESFVNNTYKPIHLVPLLDTMIPSLTKVPYDCVDKRTVVLFLEEALKKLGYKVTAIDPFLIESIKKEIR